MKYASGPERHLISLLSWLCLVLLFALEACSGPRGQPKHLPDLHLPLVKQVPGFEDFSQKNAGSDSEQLNNFTAYQPYGPGLSGRILIATEASLLDIGLDGSGGQQVADRYLCIDRPAVIRDSLWFACTSSDGKLTIQSLAEAPPYTSHPVSLGASFPRLVAWGPDGKRLVAVENEEWDCRLNIYDAKLPYLDARLVARIRIPQLDLLRTDGIPCGYYDLGWSPDGRWLAMSVLTVDRYGKIYALDLSKLPLPTDNTGTPPVELTTPPDAIENLGGQGGAEPRLTWPNAPNVVTITSFGGIVDVDLLTHERPILLKQDVGQICGASWTPDGTQLVFSLCAPCNFEIAGARPQLYVYTP